MTTSIASPRPLVLLVDDDDPLREALAMMLEDAGDRVLQVAGSRKALALLTTAPAIDTLMTDLSMLGPDGVAAIRWAQERCPGLPAMPLTGHAGDGTAPITDGTGAGSIRCCGSRPSVRNPSAASVCC